MNAFYDTNVLLDVLLERRPFYEASARAWTLAEVGRLEGYVAAVTMTNVFYVMVRTQGREAAAQAIRAMLDIFSIVACDAQLMNQAIDSDISDFEDAVQYFSALRAGADCILSRDLAGYPSRPAVPVLSPAEFLAKLEVE